jgi:hypothetical protein
MSGGRERTFDAGAVLVEAPRRLPELMPNSIADCCHWFSVKGLRTGELSGLRLGFSVGTETGEARHVLIVDRRIEVSERSLKSAGTRRIGIGARGEAGNLAAVGPPGCPQLSKTRAVLLAQPRSGRDSIGVSMRRKTPDESPGWGFGIKPFQVWRSSAEVSDLRLKLSLEACLCPDETVEDEKRLGSEGNGVGLRDVVVGALGVKDTDRPEFRRRFLGKIQLY